MITDIDFKILDAIQGIANPVLDTFFVFVTHLGDEGILWILTALVMLCFKKTRKCGIMLGVVLILGVLVGNLALKNIIARPRPFVQNPEMLDALLISAPSGYSCPSGHTLSSIECAVVIFLNDKKEGIPALIVAVLIAFSRMYLYVHFLTDILLGAAIGVALAFLVYHFTNKIEKRMISYGKKI